MNRKLSPREKLEIVGIVSSNYETTDHKLNFQGTARLRGLQDWIARRDVCPYTEHYLYVVWWRAQEDARQEQVTCFEYMLLERLAGNVYAGTEVGDMV